MTTRSNSRWHAVALLAAGLLAAPSLRAQTPTEGYDPLRQITAQLMKANLHIVLDVTGSMVRVPEAEWRPGDYGRNNPLNFNLGANGFGYLRWEAPDSDTDCPSGLASRKCWVWDLAFYGPVRMGIVKNALGAGVPLVTTYSPPTVPPVGWTRKEVDQPYASVRKWRYRFVSATDIPRPPAPFTPYETITIAGTSPAFPVANFPIVRNGSCELVAGDGSTCTYLPPQDLIEKNKERVNWGLTSYATDRGWGNDVITHVEMDVLDGNKDLAKLKDYFLPAGATGLSGTVGLGTGTYTNTRAALEEGQKAIKRAVAKDPKGACERPYGVILVTDGLSNRGNPDDGNWIHKCSPTGRASCDVVYAGDVSSGYDCPDEWTKFAAHWANELYTNTQVTLPTTPVTTVNVPVRTWTIGVSSQVGPCELDFIAYMGRTDASSPAGDAGFGGYDKDKNPFIPGAATTTANYDGPTGQYDWFQDESVDFDAAVSSGKSHGHNAFFATTAEKLGDALVAIVNATATGDYATNAPVSGMSAGKASVVYLPSTEFPAWKGHIYAYDTAKLNLDGTFKKNPLYPDFPHWLEWDAGLELNKMDAAKRKIFTWDPTTRALVEVTSGNLGTLKTLSGDPDFTDEVIDFIRGNDGTLTDTPRSWRLGPMINSAPALVGAPNAWRQLGKVVEHSGFRSKYAPRDALLWVGSSDGLMHAFRVDDGSEQIALLPPELLKNQVDRYEAFVNDPRNPPNPSGQSADASKHLYGVASSLRFGDVYDDTSGVESYKTVGILSLGAGGTTITALDLTDVPPITKSPYPTNPVAVLWRKVPGTLTANGELPDLQQTWSIPAMGPVHTQNNAAATEWRLLAGSGFRPTNTRKAQIDNVGFLAPRAYVLDPSAGSVFIRSFQLTEALAPKTPFVGNQAFADTVFFDPKAKFFLEDNVATQALQADLNGRIWFVYEDASPAKGAFTGFKKGIDASVKVGQSQPIYYNPAASGYGDPGSGCVAYAFGSGALYERSGLVTGSDIGTSGDLTKFMPNLFVATSVKPTEKKPEPPAVPDTGLLVKQIQGAWTYKDAAGVTHTLQLGRRTQLTAPPFLLVPKAGTGTSSALFLLYDPDLGCRGFSYVAIIEFDGGEKCLAPSNVTYTAYPAGKGAASGFALVGTRVLVAKSGIGEGEKAGLVEPSNIKASLGGGVKPKVKWWKELK